MINETKKLLNGKLVEARTRCNRCKSLGLRNPADVQGGQLDAKEVGPWTRWNGDLNAPILVVGQEWGDVSSFERQGGLDNAKSKTNEVLVDLLSSVGVVVQSAPNGVRIPEYFLQTRRYVSRAAARRQRWTCNG